MGRKWTEWNSDWDEDGRGSRHTDRVEFVFSVGDPGEAAIRRTQDELVSSATLVFGGGVERLFQDGRGVRSPFGVQVGLAVVCVGLAVAYFVAALAALSVPPGTPWRVWVVGVAYLLLGEVLGASFVMPWRLLRLEKEASSGGAGEGLEA